MFTHAPAVLAPDRPTSLDVQVIPDAEGGWRIDAVCDGHVVATRHTDDWHRVERVRRALAAGLTSALEHERWLAAARAAAMTETR